MDYHIDKYIAKNLIPFSINLISTNNKKHFTFIPQFSQITEHNYTQFINDNMNGLAIRLGMKNDGYYIILLDIDDKEDTENMKNGMAKWRELIKNKNITTMTQKTGNNGLHYLFKINKEQYETLPTMITGLNIEGVKYSIDFKSKNQFVIVEPTIYDNKKYKWNDIDEDIQIMPEWIYEMLCNNKKQNKIEYIEKKEEEEINIFYEKISLEDLENYVSYLSKTRSNNYDEWINVGICLNNINTNSLGIWIDFSKKSNKFRLGECEEKWKTFEKSEKSWIGILHKWIEEDNKDNYNEIKKLMTTQRVINKNKFEGHENRMKVEELSERRDHNVVWFKDNQENILQLEEDDNMIVKMYPEKMALIKRNIVCNEKELIIRKHELNVMFSLTQITNYYNNIVINNNYVGKNINANDELENENIFDDKIINNLIYDCVNICTPNYFAKLMYHKCKGSIIFNKKNGWYIFDKNWRKLGDLRNMISDELYPLFKLMKDYYKTNDKALTAIQTAILWLNDKRNKSDIVYELEHNNENNNFSFNEKKHLVSFNNGVYDLENKIFREKKCEDRITFSTNYDYISEYTNNYDKLINLLNKIQPEKKYLEYMLNYLSLCLGNCKNKVITAIDGKITKAKSKLLELIKLCFGDYFATNECKESINLIDTNKKIIIIKSIGQNLDTKYDELLRSNKINVIIDCDKLPKMSENQITINSKLRTLNLSSKNEVYEENINDLKQDFMLMLIKIYEKNITNNFRLIPNAKNLLWLCDTDIYLKFLNEKTIVGDMNLKTSVIYDCFAEWVKQYMAIEMIPNQKKFAYGLRKHRTLESFRFNGKPTTGLRKIKLL